MDVCRAAGQTGQGRFRRRAIANSQRASNLVATTEGALSEVANLLNDIQRKIVEAANVGAASDDEIHAHQLQIDSAIANQTPQSVLALLR
jgi:flagellin